MRLKHVKNADVKLENSNYVIKNPENYKGKYKNVFNNTNPIHIEIGTGKGNFIIEMAKKYPNINFVGIEKYDSVLVRVAEKLEETDYPNLKLIRYDASNIEQLFDKEISLIYLNFSDPWPKERHEKRRLMSPNFLKKYENIFKSTNHIIFKTDNRKLFEYALTTFNNFKFHINTISLRLQDDMIDNVETEYEIKFKSMGYPIYMVDIEK